jgi:hypothetical protein
MNWTAVVDWVKQPTCVGNCIVRISVTDNDENMCIVEKINLNPYK